MKDLFHYVHKLRKASGWRLYMNMAMTIAISSLDGIGIYLIVPLLGIIGALQIDTDAISLLSGLETFAEGLSIELSLPLVLGLYVLIVGGQALLQRFQTVQNTRILQRYVRTLRMEMYGGLLRAKWEFFLRKRKSDFHHVMVNELGRVSYGTSLLLQMATGILFTVIQIGLAFFLSPLLTLVVIGSGALLAVFSRKFVRKAGRIGDKTTELSQSFMAGISDHFNGIKDIKSNRLENSHLSWFDNLSRELESNVVGFIKVNSLSQFTYKAASIVLIAGFVYLALEVLHTPAEQLLLIVLIFSRLWPRFIGIQSNIEQLASSLPAFKAMRKLQEEADRDRELEGSGSPGEGERCLPVDGIECRRVYYRYDTSEPAYALRDINVKIPANRMTAIVGKSGAGKSTLIDMLMGLIKPERGEVLLDGAVLSEERQLRSLRSSIGYVAQDPFLFNASLRDNLKLVAPQAKDDELWEALKFSASEKFVRKLPQGLDTVIGDRGIRLSGGERQRIVLARAILKRPSILVLDEATSALDSENERLIQEALERLKGKLTIIVIAHRLSTIRHADQVIVMDQGEIIQQGGYQQLSQETKGKFRQLLNYQSEAVPAGDEMA
ncbi:ABC transporter ATP-binding protein [Paenibacillus thailandensis]|uniref:ABC transporter ATP-binding protein n=1 Tax=Paenibacillus thailandensis TaxID=393250 RepID=A0ABW5QYG5_9BACL